MTLGQRIKKLRTEKGLTQKDLASQMNVAFQTISKWEADTNEPDIATLKQLAKIFECSIDDLLSEEETIHNKEKEVVITPPRAQQVEKETIIIRTAVLPRCKRCGKPIEEKDLISVDAFKTVRTGRLHKKVPDGKDFYHKECYEIKKREEARIIEEQHRISKKHGERVCFGWGIPSGLIAFGIALAVFILNPQFAHPALGALYSILIGYGVFSAVYRIISNTFITEIFVYCAKLTIKFPGLIFSFSLDGFAWLIGMKILFAICSFLIGCCSFLLAIGLSSIFGAFAFPFILVRNNREFYTYVV